MIHLKRLLTIAFVAVILLPLALPGFSRAQREDTVTRMMEDMSSAAKVGQLFLVTFPGAEVTDEALITELIRDYHVGGVVIRSSNGNIANEGSTLVQVATLTGQLQEVAWEATRQMTETSVGEELFQPFIPLFVAVNHEGNGIPFTSIVDGTTPLPSEMALGATWDPAYAEAVGQVAGQELHALGVNMLLGPSLDVLETPHPESAGDLGVRTFGGDPFWVGQMGQAYIRGVHEGAEGRVAAVAKHFPGLGTSDRSLEEEVSTVQRTLEKLKQVDLAPFFTVAQAEDPLARPDGLLVSHIRFRGLEGERFVPTRPISVDSQVLQRLMNLPELADWRKAGGVTVSDGLGIRALRRFYDPSEENFNSRRIAREAFLAGNDILILSQFALNDNWEKKVANIENTISFFQERYDSDPSFQALVDASVARILRLKLALYGGSFDLGAVQPNVSEISERIGTPQETLSSIGRDAITLLSPPSSDLVPAPPTTEDNIVIFTDGRSERPCSTCNPVPYIDPLELQETIVRLYGPRATGQISPWRVSSFTLSQLEEYLDASPSLPPPTPTSGEEITPTLPYALESTLRNADWIIFAMLGPAADAPQSGVVRRFLAERADALSSPQLVVLAYDVPYYMDATEISKLSAYYAAYSRIDSFIEASVRALFGEFAPMGALPVSMTGINYDLLTQTTPDPEQIISLYTGESFEGEEQTPEPPQLEIGDELKLHTGVIVDHNGHPVPDGTPVQFIFTYPQEGLEHSMIATTHDGVAEMAAALDRVGQLNISVQADPAPRTVALQIVIQEGEEVTVVPITPTSRPTPEPTSTPIPEETEEGTAETPQPTRQPDNGEVVPTVKRVRVLDLALALSGVLIIASAGYYAVRFNSESVSRALRLALWCIIGGLALYLIYALLLPEVDWLQERSNVWITGWIAWFGSLLSLGVAWGVSRRRKRT